jgi:hypothetical protein
MQKQMIGVKLPPEWLSILQAEADRLYEGNVSMLVRKLLKEKVDILRNKSR